MSSPKLGFVVMLMSVAELHAVRDSRLETATGHKNPDETFSKLFAQGANPCGGVFLSKLREPEGNQVVTNAWNKINEPIVNYLTQKEEMIADLLNEMDRTAKNIAIAEQKTVYRKPPPEEMLKDMLSDVCQSEFSADQYPDLIETDTPGLDNCLQVQCGLEVDLCEANPDAPNCMYDQKENFVPKFIAKYRDNLSEFDFAKEFDVKCKTYLPPDADDEMEYDLDSNWCAQLCNVIAEKVNDLADDSGSGTAAELAKALNTLKEELRQQAERLSRHKEEKLQCEEAQKGVLEFVDTMQELGKDHADRSSERQVIQFQARKAQKLLKHAKTSMEKEAEKEAAAVKDLDDKDAKEKDLLDAVAEQDKLEKDLIAELARQEGLVQDAQGDLDALYDASNRVAEFKMALSLILLKISLLYDSVINNPLRKLLVNEVYLRETFVDPDLVISGQSGKKTLVTEIRQALTNIKVSCDTTVLAGVKTITYVSGRLTLPSEHLKVNASFDSPEIQKLIEEMPRGVDEIQLPDGFLPPIEERDPRVIHGLPDMCESPEVSAVEHTVEQVLEVVNKRRTHLIDAFMKILSIANQELELSVVHHHHEHDGPIDEEQYECEHEPKGTAKFAAIFGEINFYKRFVKMWAHMDSGSGLSYFMRLEAMLEYLFLVAQSKEADHMMDLSEVQRKKDDATKGLDDLIVKLEEATNDKDLSQAAHEAAAELLGIAQKKHADHAEIHKQLTLSLKEANEKVEAALNAAKEKHEEALEGTGGRTSLLAMVMKKEYKLRSAKKSQVKAENASNKQATDKKEAGLYGNDAAAWQKEARELEVELERLRKGAVYLPFLKQ